MTQRNRLRNFCFTINNFTNEDLEALQAIECKYLVVGSEIGDKGTPHLQGYIELGRQVAFSTVKDMLPRAHIEKRRGTAQEAADYCKKEGHFIEEGAISKPGRRTDLSSIKELVLGDEMAFSDIVREHCDNFQQLRYAENLRKYKKYMGDDAPIVIWFCGATGKGKTRVANLLADYLGDEKYVALDDTKFMFDGYCNENTIIIDDFRTHSIPFSILLKICDRYHARVQVKGSSVQISSKYIFITSPHHPVELFGHIDEEFGQLMRRISYVWEM